MKAQDSRKSARFRMDEQGTVAVMFGLLAIPVVLFVGLAVDYSRAVAVDRDLQEAVDAAAMAAATYKMNRITGNSSTSTSSDTTIGQGDARSARQVALNYLKNNFKSGAIRNLSRDAIDGETNLTVTASAEVATTFGALVVDKFTVNARASAKMSGKPAPLCMLGLNAAAPATIKAWGTADLVAPECAVLSNSKATDGLVVGGSATMTGAAFCSAGGHTGTAYTPAPKDNCPQQADPYAGKYTASRLSSQGINLMAPCNVNNSLRVREDSSYSTGSSGVYVFCGGVRIASGATMNLGPGVFVFYSTLTVNSGATLKATEGTTIVFANSDWMGGTLDGQLYVVGGGNVLITAPKSGPLDSVAVLQPSVSYYTGGTSPANEHLIIGGGTVEIIGNWYTPQSKTRVTGNGVINATSPYFSMISDFVEMEGNGQLILKAGGDPSSIGMEAVPGQVTTGAHISLVE